VNEIVRRVDVEDLQKHPVGGDGRDKAQNTNGEKDDTENNSD
jgi:hypothetical protein